VARRSLELGVKLHAACHDGYTVMFSYVRRATAKKPLSELDHQVWFLEDHPQALCWRSCSKLEPTLHAGCRDAEAQEAPQTQILVAAGWPTFSS